MQVDVFWGHEGDTFDPFAQVIKKTVTIHVDEPRGELLEVSSVMEYRQYTFQEMASLARLSGFEVRTLSSVPQTTGGPMFAAQTGMCSAAREPCIEVAVMAPARV